VTHGPSAWLLLAYARKRFCDTELDTEAFPHRLHDTVGVKPLLLMDVDGPLNPFRARWFPDQARDHGYDLHSLTTQGNETFTVALHSGHGSELTDLARGYELVWATTWGEDANRLVSPILGLPTDLAVVPMPGRAKVSSARRAWKSDLIVEWCAGRQFAWFDDEINRATRDWIAHQPGVGKHLALRVPAERGLLGADFDLLRDFMA